MILAGGRGERMSAGRNKALIEIAGQPLLLYSVATFRRCCDRLVLVSAEADVAEVQRLVGDALVVPGGHSRHGSEWSALRSLRTEVASGDVIAIHDAARPLVAAADVRAVFEAAQSFGAAMLAAAARMPALELAQNRVARAYLAAELWRAQTPQAARAAWLLDAYQRAADEDFNGTDTAEVLERAGYAVRIVAASAENPKITIPADLEHAERLLGDAGTPHA